MAVADGLNIETKSPDVMFASEATKSQAFFNYQVQAAPQMPNYQIFPPWFAFQLP